MNRPRARAGLTPISSRVRTADDEPDPELDVGGGDPETIGCPARCRGGRVSIGDEPGAPAIATTGCGLRDGAPSTAGTGGRVAAGEAGAGGTVPVRDDDVARRWGSLAIWPRRSRTVCGRS